MITFYTLNIEKIFPDTDHSAGGIALAYKKTLQQFINPIDSQSKLVLWFVISKRLTKKEDILCGIIYLPPESSDYSVIYPFQEIETELNSFKDRYLHFLLFGDCNARTKNLPDFIEIDPYICRQFDSEELLTEFEQEITIFRESNNNISIYRVNRDKSMNNYGYRMLDFCKCNNLYILNGRTYRDKDEGHFTCKGSSTVDYFLCSLNLLPPISDFCVEEFSDILSDVHCPVYLELCLGQSHELLYENTQNSKTEKLWDETNKENFIHNFDLEMLNDINESISMIKTSDITQQDLDNIIHRFNNLVITSAEKTFNRPKGQKYKPSKRPSWFGNQCLKARKLMNRAHYHYKQRKNLERKTQLKIASKIYKQTVRRFHSKFRQDNILKLKKLKRENPKKYWKLLNGKQTDKVEASPESLFNYFKSVNFDENAVNTEYSTDLPANEAFNTEINQPFTEEDVTKAIHSLKNNKACGIDLILNEHLKSLSPMIIPTLLNIFNLIFDTGIVPEVWTLGMIKPIYKCKGDREDPSNYRPITLISCLGKVFTAMLNNRIQTFAEKYDLLK